MKVSQLLKSPWGSTSCSRLSASDEYIFDLFRIIHIPVSNILDLEHEMEVVFELSLISFHITLYVLSLPFFPGGSQILVYCARRQLSD